MKPSLNVTVLWVDRDARDELIVRSVADKTWTVDQITEIRGDHRAFHVAASTETREGARDLGRALERSFPDLEQDSEELTRVLTPYAAAQEATFAVSESFADTVHLELPYAATADEEPADPFPPETSTPPRRRHGRAVNWLKDVLVLLVLSGAAGMAFGALALGLIT